MSHYISYDGYSSEDDINVRVHRHHEAAPAPTPVHYVQARDRPRSYYATGPSPAYLAPERTMIRTTTRSRSRERRSSPPTTVVMPAPAPLIPPQHAPVIIKNYNNYEQSSDEESGGGRMMHRSRSHSYSSHHGRNHSHSQSRSRAGSDLYMTREEYEMERKLEQTRRELEQLKIAMRAPGHSEAESYDLKRSKRELEDLRAQQERDREAQRTAKEFREEAELRAAKHELDEIKRREEKEAEEKRIKREMELKQLAEEKREEEERKRRDKVAQEAIAKYKQQEAERVAKEKKEKEQAEREFQRRLQEQLIASGVDEKDIQAIIEKKKIKQEKQAAHQAHQAHEAHLPLAERPTYTRMSRRHLSIETLRVKGIDFELDANPEYVLIRRWVPEDEQDILWRHTKSIRERRDSKLLLQIDDGKHHHRRKSDDGFEWVRKKERKRSKSPALLMYLAGQK